MMTSVRVNPDVDYGRDFHTLADHMMPLRNFTMDQIRNFCFNSFSFLFISANATPNIN